MTRLGMTRAYETVTEAFEDIYKELISLHKELEGAVDPSRDGAVAGEIMGAHIIIRDPTRNLIESPMRNLSYRYAIGELLWYLSGSDRVSDITPYSKAWERLSDDGVTVNSAYGNRIVEKFGFDQWEHVIQLLKKDPLSRQAVIHIKDASDKPTKDLPCTVCLQFIIREGKLHCFTYMRSNDIWLGFPYDVFSFTSLQILMAMTLHVPVGEYHHIAGSLHLYERNLPKDSLKQALENFSAGAKAAAESLTFGNLIAEEENCDFTGEVPKKKKLSPELSLGVDPGYYQMNKAD